MNVEGRIEQYKNIMEPTTSEGFFNHINKLVKLGFFTAPASTKYHGAYEGGLFDHSFITAKTLVELTERLELKWERPESPYIVGIFHDLCKCDNYISHAFDKTYSYNPNIIIPGHGDKSVITGMLMFPSNTLSNTIGQNKA